MPRRKESLKVDAIISVNWDSLRHRKASFRSPMSGRERTKYLFERDVTIQEIVIGDIAENFHRGIVQQFKQLFKDYANKFEGENPPFMVKNNWDVGGLNTKRWRISKYKFNESDSEVGLLKFSFWLKNDQEDYPYTHVVEKKTGVFIYHNIVGNLAARRLCKSEVGWYYPKEDVPYEIDESWSDGERYVDVISAPRQVLRFEVAGKDIFREWFRNKGETSQNYRKGIINCAKKAFKNSLKGTYPYGNRPAMDLRQ